MHLLFSEPEPPILNILYGWSEICRQFGLFSLMFSFVIPSWLIIFCIFIIILIYLIFSVYVLFLHWFYTEFTNCVLLSSLALSGILLTSSVNTLYFSLLNLCCDFNISLLFTHPTPPPPPQTKIFTKKVHLPPSIRTPPPN